MKKIALMVIVLTLFVTQYSFANPLGGVWSIEDGFVTLIYPDGDGTTNIGDEFLGYGYDDSWSFEGLIRSESFYGDFIDNNDGTAFVNHEIYRTGGTFQISGDKLWGQDEGTNYEISIQSYGFGTNYFQWSEDHWVRTNFIGSIYFWGKFIDKPFLFELTGDIILDFENSLPLTYIYPYDGEIFNAIISVTPEPAALQEMVEYLADDGTLNVGQAGALLATLSNVAKNYDRGNTEAAINNLNAFIKKVEAYIKGGIFEENEGVELIDQANTLINYLSL
jgi:hypothetical protein